MQTTISGMRARESWVLSAPACAAQEQALATQVAVMSPEHLH
jgi:hypothetical protein